MVKQSFFGPPGQCGRLVTRVNSIYKSTRERVDSKGLYGSWRLHLMGSCTESVLLLSDVAVDRNEDGLHFEKFSLNFVKVFVPIKAKPKMYHGLLFLQKIDR